MSTVYIFQTFQQAQAAGEQPDFIRRFVQQHCSSGPYRMALDADLYDAQKNPGLNGHSRSRLDAGNAQSKNMCAGMSRKILIWKSE